MAIVAEKRAGAGIPARSEALGAVAPAGLDGRFHAWRGRSGRRYVVSVYPADAAPDYAGAVVIAVRRTPCGRTLLQAEAVEAGSQRLPVPHDADELHFHLLAGDPEARRSVAEDLAGPGSGPDAGAPRTECRSR